MSFISLGVFIVISVIHDFLSFTFRPQSASSQWMINQLRMKHEGAEWHQFVRENIKRAKWEGMNMTAPAQELFKLLDTGDQRIANEACSKMGLKLLENLKSVISDFYFEPRGFGHFGYLVSYALYRGGKQCGMAAWGGRNCGVFVQLTGRGCAEVDFKLLHSTIKDLPEIKLTRVDLAADCKRGEYDFNWCKEQYAEGGFTSSGRTPTFTEIKSGGRLDDQGNEFFDGGRSFYVGKRENGKMFRGYEKGKQLLGKGVVLAPEIQDWFRLEVEIHNNSRKIPLDILLDQAAYFAAAYPCLGFVSALAKPIKTLQKVAKAETQKLINHARTSYGSLVRVLRRVGKSDSEIVEMLISKRDRLPRRLNDLQYFNTA